MSEISSTSHKAKQKAIKAKARWARLRNILLSRTTPTEESHTQHRPSLFKLIPTLEVKQSEQDIKDNLKWMKYIVTWTDTDNSSQFHKYTIKLCQRIVNQASFLTDCKESEKSGVDNTGNVGLWPAEEIFTYTCTKKPNLFKDKRVLELGAGVGLLSFSILMSNTASEICVTDGNPGVVKTLKYNTKCFQKQFKAYTKITAQLLMWHKMETYKHFESYFDIILISDW